jgi:3-oxoacyl-[acyl-carrier protein] reductase
MKNNSVAWRSKLKKMLQLDLTGKTALVCGSTQGIGKAAAELLASMGATVVLMARNPDKLIQVSSSLPRPAKQEHSWIAADFSDLRMLELVLQSWVDVGNVAHILVNNTGGPPAGPIQTAKTQEFTAAFNSHLLANHILVQKLLPGMRKAGYGRIINVISTSVKQPLKGLGVSNTIRAAVANWAKTLSLEVAADGITVNNVLPGATRTVRLESIIENKAAKTGHEVSDVAAEMLAEIPAGRFGEAHEIGSAIAFLASPAAAYINGINLPVDGGRTGNL